ncbi:hypothetical protein EQ718_07560 [Paracoccus versutus]|uniref:Uncharacterized protein n=1 Tax=Paracoccus versutus TaxID=34007 RepID=A0AAQ0KMV5_PARVE|nr:hypothetical protein [Paracoccus versutus]KGJ09332.1 hypothetical protein IT40_15860 [Paracoccus versutus]REG52482.1 hypothetical protein ATH84_100854 [Paracoccus versutus]WEJ78745.1 hypothetical protein EQ718_07560 [Paracoccus versutus]
MESEYPFDELSPEEVHIEAIEGFHLGGTRYSASFELSDQNSEFARSFLLEVDCGETLTFSIRQQVENTIMSHASLGDDRHLVLRLGGRMYDLTPEGDGMTFLPNGVLRRIFHIDGGPQYVVGDGGVCYLRDREGWQEVPPLTDRALRDIHGPHPELIHACGNAGTLLRLRDRQWEAIEMPDQRDFTALEVADSGHIHIGGPDGLALALRDDELVELAAPARDFFGIRSFKGRRYWSDANWGLNIQEGDSIVPFRELRYAFYMHASAEKLVISGWKEIFIFDGENWEGFEMGYDGNIFLRRLDMADYGG